MQVNIAILVVCCSLRAENITTTTQSGSAAPWTQVYANLLQRQGKLSFFLLSWVAYSCTWGMHGVEVQCGCPDTVERFKVRRPVLKPWASPEVEASVYSGEEPQSNIFLLFFLFFRFIVLLSSQELGAPG